MELWVVSNGGVKKGYGYLDFVIATETQILWKGQGQVQGNSAQMESLQAESSGGLAPLRFLV
eukprot:7660722-Ditylum_brightwellii.AAC.1